MSESFSAFSLTVVGGRVKGKQKDKRKREKRW